MHPKSDKNNSNPERILKYVSILIQKKTEVEGDYLIKNFLPIFNVEFGPSS